MSRSIHFPRRYAGHKLYLAEKAARKARYLPDNGRDEDAVPLLKQCVPLVGCDCAGCVEYDAQCAKEAAQWEADFKVGRYADHEWDEPYGDKYEAAIAAWV